MNWGLRPLSVVVVLGFVVGLIVLGIAWAVGLDHDAGGYPDSMKTRDKKQHAGACALIVFIFSLATMCPTQCVLLMTLIGVGWEMMQRYPRNKTHGYFSWPDVLADHLGSWVGAVLSFAVLLAYWAIVR